jgi:hypothetical protein
MYLVMLQNKCLDDSKAVKSSFGGKDVQKMSGGI